METKDTLSSCSESLEEQEIQQMQKHANILKENTLNKLNALQTTIQHLLSSIYSMYYKFRDGFHRLFEADERTFKSMLSRNMQNLERQLNKETLHKDDSNFDLRVIKVQFDQFIHSKVIVSDKGNDQGLENQNNTSRDESNRSRNECNDKSTSGDDTNIKPSYDTELIVEVPYTAEYNVFAVDTQHYEQSECIINACVVKKVDSNVIPDSPNMCDNDFQTDQNAEDERAALANLIANLKLDIDENKTIQKQLKKLNASLTQELQE
nr:hypothetical protein [Tanacetum cinerariifolium]